MLVCTLPASIYTASCTTIFIECSVQLLNNILFARSRKKGNVVCECVLLIFEFIFPLHPFLCRGSFLRIGHHTLDTELDSITFFFFISTHVYVFMHSFLSRRAAETHTSNRIHFQFMHCQALNSLPTKCGNFNRLVIHTHTYSHTHTGRARQCICARFTCHYDSHWIGLGVFVAVVALVVVVAACFYGRWENFRLVALLCLHFDQFE